MTTTIIQMKIKVENLIINILKLVDGRSGHFNFIN